MRGLQEVDVPLLGQAREQEVVQEGPALRGVQHVLLGVSGHREAAMKRYQIQKLIDELRALLDKGDEDGFNELLDKIAEEYEVNIHELLMHL